MSLSDHQRLIRLGHEPIDPLNDPRISPEPNSGCWLWVGAISSTGYGTLHCTHDRRTRLAHRVVWESHHGAIPAGLQLDHLCRTPSCVNPAHLEPVTGSVNIRRSSVPWLTSKRNVKRCRAITHCPQGHEYTPDNTYLLSRSDGYTTRHCRACKRVRDTKRRAKLRAARLLP